MREFRAYYPRYRQRDMGRTVDGLSLPDDDIADLVRSWNGQVRRRKSVAGRRLSYTASRGRVTSSP